MMYLVKVTDTTGKTTNVVVMSTMSAKFVHTPLNEWVEKEFGMYSTVEYHTQVACPDVTLPPDFKADRILDLDNI